MDGVTAAEDAIRIYRAGSIANLMMIKISNEVLEAQMYIRSFFQRSWDTGRIKMLMAPDVIDFWYRKSVRNGK